MLADTRKVLDLQSGAAWNKNWNTLCFLWDVMTPVTKSVSKSTE